MLPTSALFKPGHRIRLDVTSSDFPNFDRNHNTGGDDWRESALELAHQTVCTTQITPPIWSCRSLTSRKLFSIHAVLTGRFRSSTHRITML